MNISILGCGWLGLPLALHLKNRDHNIKGSTTTVEKIDVLKNLGIQPYYLTLTPALDTPDLIQPFWESDVLILNIPPGRKRKNVIDFHTAQIKSVVQAIGKSTIKFVIFISSTSVYPTFSGIVVENDTTEGKAARDSGDALIRAERFLKKKGTFQTTVIRFGGLIGKDRHPVKYLAGKKKLARAGAPVNLIHLDDCIKIITQIIENNITRETFNAVAGEHPTRTEFYTRIAEKFGLEPPTFQTDKNSNYKIVSNEKLISVLNYNFIYPDPIKIPLNNS